MAPPSLSQPSEPPRRGESGRFASLERRFFYHDVLRHGARIGFLGGTGEPAERLSAAADSGAIAWLRQAHSATVLAAGGAGCCGTGDALYTGLGGLGLAVATADCVPLLLASPNRVAAVHAGWRGIALGVVAATLDVFDEATELTAWIGPAIGPCCYEVSEAVAVRVAAASSADAIVDARQGSLRGPRPHLDLTWAICEQLARRGVEDLRTARRCTRCHPQLASYRRDGSGAGRNWAVIWRPG